MSNSNRSSFVLTNLTFNSIFAPAPNPKMIAVTTASIGYPQALQPHKFNIPAHNHSSDPSPNTKSIQDQGKAPRLFTTHTHKPTPLPRPSTSTITSADPDPDSSFEHIPPPNPTAPHPSYDHAYEARFRLAARPARVGIFGAGVFVGGNGGGFVGVGRSNGNGNGNGSGGGGNGSGSGGNERSRAHQRRALSMKVKVETQNRSSGGPRRGKVGKGKVGFKVPSLVKNLVQSREDKITTNTTATTTTTTPTSAIIRDAKTFAEREDARALFNYKAMPISMPMSMPKSESESESRSVPSGSGPNSGCPESEPASIRTTSTSFSAEFISAPSESSSIFSSPVLISLDTDAYIPPSRPRPSAHAPWDLSPYVYWDLHDEPWNTPESFPTSSLAVSHKDVCTWTRQIKAKAKLEIGGKGLMPSWAEKLGRDGKVENWSRETGEGHGGMPIRQPRPVKAWEKALPSWVHNFDEEEDGNLAWCLSQWQGA